MTQRMLSLGLVVCVGGCAERQILHASGCDERLAMA